MTDVALRPITDADRDFLLTVYASTRAEELATIPWSDAEKATFVAQQFAAQEQAYRAYDNATFDVVLVDGEPAGRLLVARWPDEIRIMDIALLPFARGRGAGTRLIGELLAEARAGGCKVSIHVEAANPAKRLYARLGFAHVETISGGIYELWQAQ